MSYEKILVAYDSSDQAKDAVLAAVALNQDNPKRRVHVLKLVDATRGRNIIEVAAEEFSGSSVYPITDEERNELEQEIAELTEGHDLLITTEVKIGIPKDTIIQVAKNDFFDLIVMGSRGLGRFAGALGSVSYSVLAQAEMPVLIVK